MINIINNINIFYSFTKYGLVLLLLLFLNSKALVLFQYPLKNYRLINRYCGITNCI